MLLALKAYLRHRIAQLSLTSCPLLSPPQAKLPPFRFRALDMATEAPRPGMLLALDAEFVALHSLEDRSFNSNFDPAPSKPLRWVEVMGGG